MGVARNMAMNHALGNESGSRIKSVESRIPRIRIGPPLACGGVSESDLWFCAAKMIHMKINDSIKLFGNPNSEVSPQKEVSSKRVELFHNPLFFFYRVPVSVCLWPWPHVWNVEHARRGHTALERKVGHNKTPQKKLSAVNEFMKCNRCQKCICEPLWLTVHFHTVVENE